MHNRIALAFLLLASTASSAMAQTNRPCFPAQPCPMKVPFPVISPVQGLNSLTQQLRLQREGQHAEQAPPAGWYYAPVATPPPYLPPNLQQNQPPR